MKKHPRCRRHWGCEEIMYEGIKKATGLPTLKVPPKSKVWQNDLWPIPATRPLVRTLLRALCGPNWGVKVCTWFYPRHANHGGARRASNNWRTRQGNKCFSKRQSSMGWWPTRDFEDWETITHATSVRTFLPMLGKRAMFLKICGTPSLSPSTRTRSIAVIAATTEVFRSSVLLVSPLLEFLSATSKSLYRAFTLSTSEALDRTDLRLIDFLITSSNGKV